MTERAENAEVGEGVAAAGLSVAIEVDYAERVTLAMQQNGVPLVERVGITNTGEGVLHDVAVSVVIENGESEPFAARIERIEPGSTYSLRPEGLELSARKLAARTEMERAALRVEVASGGLTGSSTLPLELLPFDHWPGSGSYPELLAAFSTPNHAKVAEMLGTARGSLMALSGRDALDGYQAGSRQRASHIAEACFNAALARGIGYINPPASFDSSGQRVRLVDRICRENLGSCLDLSLLLTSLWEQAGLHPLVLLLEGHAMAAVWTHETHLADPAIDEPARLRNLIELGEIVPVEATMLTHAGTTFGAAVEAAKRKMASAGPGFCAVDIHAARKRKVRPLPLRDEDDAGNSAGIDLARLVAGAGPATVTTLDRVALADRAERQATGSAPIAAEPEESGPERILRWQTRLLDLSLVNRLINFRQSGRTIELKVPDIALVENMLADDQRFTINPSTQGDETFLREQIQSRHLYSAQPTAEMQRRLLQLYRLRRTTVEETGANPLHLALGMLKWYENPASETPRYAPLILLPVQLQRHAAGAGYRYDLSLSEEPLRPNVTLLEKLRTEFGLDTSGLDEFPEDEQGVDVPLILRNFRAAVRDMSRWEVEESAFLGLFSFNKFLMWRDLQDNIALLRQSRLVAHMVDRSAGAFDASPFPQPERLDDEVSPDQIFCTRDADSSQIAAMRAAADGRTFVLEGPPGTGKSQTIANMIADGLARGKRVLFVAEKMAALSVVHRRLDQDGLGPFCLELHSAKASKKEVLVQLEAALNAAAPGGAGKAENWSAICNDVAQTRGRLNRYIRELHKQRESGESLFAVLGRLLLLGDGPGVSLPDVDLAGVTKEQLEGWRLLVKDLNARAEPIDPPHEHPLRGVGRSEWRFGLPDESRAVLTEASSVLERFASGLSAFLAAVGAGAAAEALDRKATGALAKIAELLEANPAPPAQLLTGADAAAVTGDLRKLIEIGRQRDQKVEHLRRMYRDEFLELDHLPHIDAVRSASAKGGLLRWIFGIMARRKLRPYSIAGVPELATLLSDLESARHAKQASSQLANATEAGSLLGRRWNSGQADWGSLEEMLRWCEAFREAARELESTLAQALVMTATDAEASERAKGPAAAMLKGRDEWAAAWKKVQELLVISDEAALGPERSAGWLPTARGVLARWLSGLTDLNDWCGWRQARDAAEAGGLCDLVETYERGEISREMLGDVFERGYGQAWFNAVANAVDAVREFNANSHGKTVAHFRRVDRALIDATRTTVAAQLSANAPATPAQGSGQSEVGILRRELQKKRRHLPTRKLIEAMPTLLPRLKPCFLMSPLSVAQYLDAKLPKFDLVIFDEASQIPVWDSIGAIARGANVVVVGDSRQLPPTSFFSTIDGEDDEPEDTTVDDMESILQECSAAGIPAMWLGWHYRSQHESLIAFSNHHYYDNRLHTFPSPHERSAELGVTFRHIADGIYDRGGSRTNRVEAEAVVEEVVRLLTTSARPDSIGIVTFNQAQQSLIEDLLDAKRRELPGIEHFFSGESTEPVFIKNLENVQGDERDTIIFSVGYGPDQAGKVSMNFGPLNGEGGERRLNVAVTRARRRLIVFSSLRSEQIDLKRTRAVGVRHFRTFLDYAARGPRAIAEAVDHSRSRDFETGFEHAVLKALTKRGWEVDTQVGFAGYRVDLAVRDPDTPGRYVLGIECDGAAYHSAKTARDRDRLRQSVLESLGWRIERIWSLEWRLNADRCIQAIEHAIAEARRNAVQAAAEVTAAPLPVSADAAACNDVTVADGAVIETTGEVSGEVGLSDVHEESAASVLDQMSSAELEVAAAGSETLNVSRPQLVEYRAAAPAGQLPDIDLLDEAATPQAAAALGEIVRGEGPIVQDLAFRRLAEWFGITRIGGRIRARFDDILATAVETGTIRQEREVLWPASLVPSEYAGFRIPGTDDVDVRDLEEIPLIERTNAVVHVLREQFGLPREELQREVARVFGVQRLTSRVRDPIDEAISAAIAAGSAAENAGQVTLVDR